MHEGHRQRMLAKLEHSHETLSDHELLEILLFNAIPRKNTNAIAHELLLAFGSLRGVLGAEYGQLMTIGGVGASTAAYLKCIYYCTQRGEVIPKRKMPVVKNLEMFQDHLRDRFLYEEREVIELYALDAQYRIRQCKRFSDNKNDRVAISPKEVGAFIVHACAKALVIVHNHLTYSSKPSPEDNAFTAKAIAICHMHEVPLLDHIIVSNKDMYSYFLTGELERIERTLHLGEPPMGGADGENS